MAASTGAIRAGRAFIEVFANDDKAVAVLRRFENRMRMFGQRITQLGMGMLRFGSIGASALGLLSGATLKLSANAEQTRISFETMLGSAEKAKSMLAELRKLAAQSPLGEADVGDAAKTLLGFGVQAERVIPLLRMLADVSGGNAERFSHLALVWGQIAANGKLQGQDLLQLINAGWNPLQEIAQQTGLTMAELRKRMEAGAISIGMVEDALVGVTSKGGRFFQMTEKQSETLIGKLSSLWDSIASIGKIFGDHLLPMAKSAVGFVLRLSNSVKIWLERNEKLAKTIALVVAGGAALFALLAAGGGVLIAVGIGFQLLASTVAGLVTVYLAAKTAITVVSSALAAILSPVGLVITSLLGLGGAALWSSGIVGRAVESMRSAWTALTRDMGDAWQGFVAALQAGDLQAAIEVVKASFAVAWATIAGEVRKVWADAVRFFTDVWSIASNTLSTLFINAFAAVETAWAKTVGRMTAAFAQFKIQLQLLKDLHNIAFGDGKPGSGPQVVRDAMRKAGGQALGDKARTGEKVAGIEQGRKDNLQSLQDELKGLLGRSEKAQADAVAKAQADLAKARSDLAIAVQQAGELRPIGGPSPQLPQLPQLPTLAGLSEQGASVVGTFNAAAARGFGGAGDWGQKIDQRLERSNDLLKKIEKKKGGVFFA